MCHRSTGSGSAQVRLRNSYAVTMHVPHLLQQANPKSQCPGKTSALPCSHALVLLKDGFKLDSG